MSTIDVDALLLELDSDSPCGPNLEYDPVFVALELEAQGKPEVQYGDTIKPAVDPEWKSVRRMARELFERSRDLRLAMQMLRAELALAGLPGFTAGIKLIERLLEERWDSVHPELDPDDDLDPTLRINSLAMLGENGVLLRAVKEMTLLMLPGLGPLDIRALEFATGETQPGKDQQVLSVASIEQALADIEPAVLSDVVDLLARALASVVNIEVLLVRHVGSSQALNLDMLTRPLRKAHEFLLRHQVLAPDAEDTEVLLDEGSVDGSDGAGNPGNESAGARRISGDIASREDVLRTLDKLLQYYSKHEPASPIPIFIERAKRLVPMTFMEVLEEMVPGGAAQVAVLRGPGAE